jgi:hypothetical protein
MLDTNYTDDPLYYLTLRPLRLPSERPAEGGDIAGFSNSALGMVRQYKGPVKRDSTNGINCVCKGRQRVK